MNLRLLRIVSYGFSGSGLLLALLTIVLGLDPTIRIVGVILVTIGLVLFFRWSALKTRERSKNFGDGDSVPRQVYRGQVHVTDIVRNAFQLLDPLEG